MVDRRAHILVVDDERDVREAIVNALARAGFHAVGASGVAETRDILEGRDEPFDLAVVDVALAGEESGLVLAEELYREEECRRFVFISGYLEVEIAQQPVPNELASFVGKPLGVNRLLDVVHDLLQKPPK